MADKGIDYAWEHVPISALIAYGANFVARYSSYDKAKDENLSEATALAAKGIWSVIVFESTATRAKAGHNAGAADAAHALAEARTMRMPEDRPIYFAVDYDLLNPGEVVAYFQGVNSVLGVDRTGVYTGFRGCKYLYEKKLVKWVWQTYAWSGGKWYNPSHIQQFQNDIRLGGVGCDANRATVKDYGQWKPGVSPLVTPTPTHTTEDDMPNGLLITGTHSITPVTFARGRYKTVGFLCDNGAQGAEPVMVRVAVHTTDDKKVGAWHVTTVTVDSTKGQVVLDFPDFAQTDGLSLSYASGDPGVVLVAWEVS